MIKKYAVLSPKGGTKAVQMELSTMGIHSTEGGSDWVETSLTQQQLQQVGDYSQSATQVLELMFRGSREELVAFAKSIPSFVGTFAVRSDGEDRQELQEELGAAIKDHTDAKVDLKQPEKLFMAHESDGEYVFGVDCSGPLGKRHYKIITGAQSLTGPVAYCTLRLAGWHEKQDLVVWPSATGELAIEAALAATGRSPRAYERKRMEIHEPTCRIICADPKLSLVRSAEKNAKVAGVHSAIRYSRQDADWLDTKYEEFQIKLLVGLLPNLKIQPKLVKEIFYQLDYILKKGGTASFLCVNDSSAELLEEQAKGYTLSRDYIWSGKHCYTLVSLVRDAKKTKKEPSSKKYNG